MSEARPACKRSAPAPRSARFLDAASPSGSAIRTTVAAVGAMALAFALHVEVPALAVVFVLARGSAGALTMIVGALAGSACGLVLLDLFDQSRVAFSAALLVLTTIGTYGALGRRYPYGWVQALLSLLVLVGQALDTPDAAVRHAFYDLTDVLIAAGCAFVAGASQPSAVPAQLQDALAQRLRALATVLDCGSSASSVAVLALERGARRSRALLANAWPTRLASRARGRALAAALALTDRVHDDVLVLLASARLAPETPGNAPRTGVAPGLVDVAALVAARHGAIDETRDAMTIQARTVARRIRRPADVQERSIAALVSRRTRRLAARLALLSPFLVPGTRATPRLASDSVRPWTPPALDRYRMRHAVKSAASYLLVLWAWVASEWGAVVPALVVAVLVATLATPVGATLRKAMLRVAGVFVGGLAGLLVAVVLLPFITELPAICGVAGAFILVFVWIQQHRDRLTFAALQAAIAFVLTLVHGTAPSPTWRDPLESLIGLAFGIVVVVGMMHAAWPIDATASAHATLAELLELSGRRLAAALGRSPRPDQAGHRRDVSAARVAREHAVGFAHEVELYGTQFGRPAEDLTDLARSVLELDALAALVETLPRHETPDAAGRSLDPFAAAVLADCRLLAACVRAFPGERTPCDESDLGAPRCVPRITDAEATTAHGAAWTLVTALLCDVAGKLADGTRPAHRHAA